MKRGMMAALLLLAQGALNAGDKAALTPLPGAEYEESIDNPKPNKRTYHKVNVVDIAEGSPEWVSRQVTVLCRTRGFDALAKIVSPSVMANIKNQVPATLATLSNYCNIDTQVRIGDSKQEDNRAYKYIQYQSAKGTGTWMGGYAYFLKRDGKWISVDSGEWQRGKCD